MDLRPLITSPKQVLKGKLLAMHGLLSYQPFIFADDFAVGKGLEGSNGEQSIAPSIYCPDALDGGGFSEYACLHAVGNERREEFFRANERLRCFYEAQIDQIAECLGPLDGLSLADIGCNTGYFALGFARRGMGRTVGFDRVNYAHSIGLLNEICGTNVEFKLWSYDGSGRAAEQFDVVISTAVLVHLSDPLQHLAWLGSSARKALFVFTPTHDDDDYSIRFHSVNKYYDDAFPYCFDITTVSKKLLRLSFERMGFTRIVEIGDGGHMGADWMAKHSALLGFRDGTEPVIGTRQVWA